MKRRKEPSNRHDRHAQQQVHPGWDCTTGNVCVNHGGNGNNGPALNTAAVTEDMKACRALDQRCQELQELVKQLEAYDYAVAHELKNLVSIVMGSAELLASTLDGRADEAQQKMLDHILEGTRRMSEVIDSLLLLASSDEKVTATPLDMAQIVAEVQRDLSTMIDRCGASVSAPRRWPAAQGYAPWVRSVWTNYLSNALKYGGRSPRIELGGEEQADGMVRFWMRDHGPGLAQEQQAYLFVEFGRLDRTIKPGHGLGLAIVRRIVERMGGQVGVESQPGKGCTFWFTLPAEESPASIVDAGSRAQFLRQNVPASGNGRAHQLTR